jgi:cytochrome c oxidase assembly protein subunit 15
MLQETKQTITRPLTLALAATTGMWVFAYIALLFSGQAGGEVLFVLSALCIPLAARHTESKGEGALVGCISSLINLLLVGSIVGGKAPSEMVALGTVWSLGLIVVSIVLGIIGASLRGNVANSKKQLDWQYAFFVVASALVFLMLVTGGLVTGMEAGLAVPDWPNSYGHNMLLYPLTEMISTENEGVFFEHAHRLTGMFVGLTSVIMIVCAFRWNTTKTVRWLAFVVFIMVCTQGLLGGLRVTGHLTLSQDRSVLAPNLWIGVTHGVVGQLIFAGFVWLSVLMSPSWRNAQHSSNKKDSFWAVLLVSTMVLQLILGAIYRHMISDPELAPKATHVLYTHIAVAVFVLVFASIVGLRLIGRENTTLKKCGLIILVLVGVQLLLGGGALIAILIRTSTEIPLIEVLVTTAHQANGALLLGACFATYAWVRRMIST